jgi:hypothetical protein
LRADRAGRRESTPLRLELAGERVVRGIVADADGRSLPGARVEVSLLDPRACRGPLHEEWVETGTDKDARFPDRDCRATSSARSTADTRLAGHPFRAAWKADDPPALLELAVAFHAVVRRHGAGRARRAATDVLVRMWPKSEGTEPAEASIATSRDRRRAGATP